MFKVGYCCAGNGLDALNTAYTERFMNRPQENDKGTHNPTF